MFSIPIRRALLIETHPPLAFPEGVACANVLISGESGGKSARLVVLAAAVGAALKLAQATGLAAEELRAGFFLGRAAVLLSGTASAALFGVGYIVGWRIAAVFLLGGVCNWLVAIPIGTGAGLVASTAGGGSAEQVAMEAYDTDTRFLGAAARR
jgi:putative OPT family oligopeptide transporter